MTTFEEVTRYSLYEEVWTAPVSKVAPRYGISDVALAKICRKHKIPIPPRGYWAQLKAGKCPKRIPLPSAKELDNRPLPLDRARTYDPDNPEASKVKALTPLKSIGVIEVPEVLVAPHPLIRLTSKRLKQKTAWDNPKGLRSAPSEVFHIDVTKKALDRALLIANTLINEFESRGIKVRVDSEKRLTCLEAGAVSLKIMISEHVARTKHEVTSNEKRALERWQRSPDRWKLEIPPTFDYHPTGNLTLSVGTYFSKSWRDTPKTPLEKRLHEVISGTLDLIEKYRAHAEKEERKRLAHEKAKAQYERQVELRKAEKERFDQLKENASRWEEAERLRRYIEAVEKSAINYEGETEELQEWIAWARLKADCIDPLIAVSDAILDAPEPRSPGYLYY